MSIANEIKRLQNAKQELKSAIEKRGVSVQTIDNLDVFASKLDSVPFAVKGTVTPEEDTLTVEINGLNFVPEYILLHCDELEKTTVVGALRNAWFRKNHLGALSYWKSSGVSTTANLSTTSNVVLFYDTGITLKLPDSGIAYFKKGYTYEYIISGGFAK